MIDRQNTCCFTGHRSSKLPWGSNERDPGCLRLKQDIANVVRAVYESGIRHYICGMALGCDTYFAEAVIAELAPVQARYSEILADKAYLEGVMQSGAERASRIAAKTMRKVHKKLGLAPYKL